MPIATGQQILAADVNVEFAKIKRIRKTADEVVNNSSVLQNDDELLLAMGANEVWEFSALIYCDIRANSDFKHTFTVPTGATGKWFNYKIVVDTAGTTNNPITATAFGTAVSIITGSDKLGSFHQIWGLVINGVNAGNLQYQWAQNTAYAENTKVLTNACLIAHQLA
jgi:hypothetical protein